MNGLAKSGYANGACVVIASLIRSQASLASFRITFRRSGERWPRTASESINVLCAYRVRADVDFGAGLNPYVLIFCRGSAMAEKNSTYFR